MDYDNQHKEVSALEALDDLGYERSYWNVFYYNKAQNINQAMADKEYLHSWIDRIISKISVALFLLLPIFTIIVAILYYRSKYNYTQHLVFVFHVQTVFFIMLLFFMVIDEIFDVGFVYPIFLILFLFYLYKSMRNFYLQGRFKTLIKYFILNTFFVILAIVGGSIISFITFWI